MAIETHFDVGFVSKLTAEEKQIQQNYRPVIGVHKWFARRPGALFRSLLLAEFTNGVPLSENYYRGHSLEGLTIADPFMGGGTTLFEANRAGCNVVGFDINPMAFWVVRQELVSVDRGEFRRAAERAIAGVGREVGDLYKTRCVKCRHDVPVKYFLWVKEQRCGGCSKGVDLFPGYLVAENERHPFFVLHCPGCKGLVELPELEKGSPAKCPSCSLSFDWQHGTAARNRYSCSCGHEGRYPAELRVEGPPRHRLFGMEYHCPHCRDEHKGRFFKAPDPEDLARVTRAEKLLRSLGDLRLPDDEIPDGDETKRLHRWGYSRYREMFNDRQLLSLGLLMRQIAAEKDVEARHALATVFSDCLRYQNMLCRYDSYALKCQDIFSVHGFPVGLIQCENNVLGIPGIGSGSFCHFVEKYDRAKAYCEAPFETLKSGSKKRLLPIAGERIDAKLVQRIRDVKGSRRAMLRCGSISDAEISPESFDAVFTDPPYFDNVQYAELADFCFAWLRLLLGDEFREFARRSTRSMSELTGNQTTGKGLAHFTEGLGGVFSKAASGLKPGAPFVFTYHHNDVEAYVPVVVALLDAGLVCTATLPCPAEMSASLHINGTGSSIVDTVIVCRRPDGATVKSPKLGRVPLRELLLADRVALLRAEVKCTRGDLFCLSLGHLSRVVLTKLLPEWDREAPVAVKIQLVERRLRAAFEKCEVDAVVDEVLSAVVPADDLGLRCEVLQTSLFDKVPHRAH